MTAGAWLGLGLFAAWVLGLALAGRLLLDETTRGDDDQ